MNPTRRTQPESHRWPDAHPAVASERSGPPRLRRWLRDFVPSLVFSSSLVFHLLILGALIPVVVVRVPPEPSDVVIQVTIRKDKPPAPPKKPPRKKVKRDIAVSEVKTPPKTETPPVTQPAEVPPDAKPVEPAPAPEEGPTMLSQLRTRQLGRRDPVLGLGAATPPPGDGTGTASLFQGRSGEGKQAALARGEASDASENAVRVGLEWLTKHQSPSGTWSAWRYQDQCPADDGCDRPGTKDVNFEPALTGMSLLCFLGAGHTQTEGKFQDTVGRGLRALLAAQKEDGSFGQKHSHLMYNHGIATLALAEAYAMSRDPSLLDPLRRAVAFIDLAQQPGGGWDYTQEITNRNDTSVTGWVVMALKSASVAGVPLRWETLLGALQHFDRATQSNGEVLYADQDPGKGRKYVGMLSVGMLCRQFLGWPRTDPRFEKQADLMLQALPSWQALTTSNFNNFYYWYYATLALYQHGGEAWKVWNAHIRDMLCEHQRQDGHANGSWDPDDIWLGRYAGRMYSTTMAILCLEVYYRYLRMYEDGGGGIRGDEVLVQAFCRGNKQQRLQALKLLAQFGDDIHSNLLRTALNDPDPFVQIFAAEELRKQSDHSGLPALVSLLEHPNGFVRAKALALLAEVKDPIAVPGLAKALMDEQAFVAEKAAMCLVKITGKDFGYKPASPPEKKREVRDRYIEWWKEAAPARETSPAPSARKPEAPIRGKILAVRPDVQLVMLDVGRKHGVKILDQFVVYRDGNFAGVVEVTQVVDDGMSSARILEGYNVTHPREGDIAVKEPK